MLLGAERGRGLRQSGLKCRSAVKVKVSASRPTQKCLLVFSFYKDFNYLMWLLCGYIVFVSSILCRCLSHHSDRMSL